MGPFPLEFRIPSMAPQSGRLYSKAVKAKTMPDGTLARSALTYTGLRTKLPFPESPKNQTSCDLGKSDPYPWKCWFSESKIRQKFATQRYGKESQNYDVSLKDLRKYMFVFEKIK